jgi:methyl-accepting chemotaxis protein
MLENFSLKSQFKLLILPVMVLTAILLIFISYSEHQNSNKLQLLEKDIHVIEDLRKLVALFSNEREISLKVLSSDEKLLSKRASRELSKQRSINDTRIKSLQNKLEAFTKNELKTRPFLIKVEKNILFFNEKLKELRDRVNNNQISDDELMGEFSSIVVKVIDTIATSSLSIEDSDISKNIIIYSIFLKYQDTLSQRDIFLEKVILSQKIEDKTVLELSKIESGKSAIVDIASSLIEAPLLSHYERISSTEEILIVDNLSKSIIAKNLEEVKKLTAREFNLEIEKYQKKLKELDDYISKDISEELNRKIDSHNNREAFLTIIFLTSILVILLSTYAVYNYLRETLFFGTIKIKSKILRVITDISLSSRVNHSENEIKSLITFVSAFVEIIKETLSKIRVNFRDVVNLSNHLSESSETIVRHIQKQSRYLEDINLQMAIFLENIKNSEISFENLKEIIEDSSAKISNLNLDVVYISYEVLSIKDLNRKAIDNKDRVKDLMVSTLVTLENMKNESEEIKVAVKNLNTMISIVEEQIGMIDQKDKKLSNLGQIALTIKKDAELNNANLSDILGVITVLGYETKSITSEIYRTVEDNNKFIEISKNMVNKSEFVSSDVKMLNKYIVNLDKEFNKFRF